MQPPDEDLVASILAGDQQLFAELVGRYRGRLVNYLFRMLRNEEDAHDLTQEVFVKIYGALDRFDPRYRFSTWLFRVAQNAAIDKIRKRRLKLVSLHRPDTGEGDSGEWELPGKERTPYQDARNVERGQALVIADQHVRGSQREAVHGARDRDTQVIVAGAAEVLHRRRQVPRRSGPRNRRRSRLLRG